MFLAVSRSVSSQLSDANSTLSSVSQAMRTLSWKPHLGSVTLDLELEDRTLTNLTVSPIQAAIILHFQEKSNDLSLQTGFTSWFVFLVNEML